MRSKEGNPESTSPPDGIVYVAVKEEPEQGGVEILMELSKQNFQDLACI